MERLILLVALISVAGSALGSPGSKRFRNQDWLKSFCAKGPQFPKGSPEATFMNSWGRSVGSKDLGEFKIDGVDYTARLKKDGVTLFSGGGPSVGARATKNGFPLAAKIRIGSTTKAEIEEMWGQSDVVSGTHPRPAGPDELYYQAPGTEMDSFCSLKFNNGVLIEATWVGMFSGSTD